MKEINVNDIDKISDAFIIDVREDEEVFETGTIKGGSSPSYDDSAK